MRIAYLTQSFPPTISGAALVVDHLTKALAERGHQVLVIAPSDSGKYYSTQEKNVFIARLRSHHNPLRSRQRFMLLPHREILQTLRRFQPEVIHIHDNLQIGLVGIEYAYSAGIPSVTTTHQLPWFAASSLPVLSGVRGYLENALWSYARWHLRQYTQLVTPTRTIAQVIRENTGLSAQTISYGTDLSRFHPSRSQEERNNTRTRFHLPVEAPIILHVGQLHVGKLVHLAIEAAAIAMQNTGAHLLVVGDGPQKTELMDLCTSLGIPDRSHFPGFITLEEGLASVYRSADLFVTASEIETQGIVLLEAAASGLPIVAVNATCIHEIVHHGENGFLAEPGNIPQLGSYMEMLLEDKEKAAVMGKASCMAAQQHDFFNTADAHEKLYRQLILQRTVTRSDDRAKRRVLDPQV